MGAIAVSWEAEDERLVVEDVVELRLLLEQLGGGPKPLLVELTRPNGDSLSIGLGRETSVLSFVQDSDDPPYFVSMGGKGSSSDPVHFFLYGTWSEFPPECFIPVHLALDAAIVFAETGELDKTVDWDEG